MVVKLYIFFYIIIAFHTKFYIQLFSISKLLFINMAIPLESANFTIVNNITQTLQDSINKILEKIQFLIHFEKCWVHFFQFFCNTYSHIRKNFVGKINNKIHVIDFRVLNCKIYLSVLYHLYHLVMMIIFLTVNYNSFKSLRSFNILGVETTMHLFFNDFFFIMKFSCYFLTGPEFRKRTITK